MDQYVCRECGYTFSAENVEPDYDELIETDEPMQEPACPTGGGKADAKQDE